MTVGMQRLKAMLSTVAYGALQDLIEAEAIARLRACRS